MSSLQPGQMLYGYMATLGLRRSGLQNLPALIQPHHEHLLDPVTRLASFTRWSMGSPIGEPKKPPNMGAIIAGPCPPLIHLQ